MRIHELDESLNKSKRIREAGPFSYGAKKPRKGSLAQEIQQKRKQQDKNYKPIEPKDQMVGVAKISKGNVKEEFDLCNYHGIESSRKPAIANSHFTENNNILDEATYSAGGGIGLDFKVKDTVRHSLLGDVLVAGFDGSSAIVKNSEGKMFKVSPAGLTLVKKASAAIPLASTQPAPAPVIGAPIGQSITYNTTGGPVKFTKTSKGWEALFGTIRKVFTSTDDTYNKLEKMWQMQG